MQSNQNKPAEVLPLYKGLTKQITLPSGRVVNIRETNGDDEELLSEATSVMDGTNIAIFLQSILLPEDGRAYTTDEIEDWPINDKYGLIFKQRLFNHGFELKFSHSCTVKTCKQTDNYTEDLKQFDADLSDDKLILKPQQIFPYKAGSKPVIEFTLTSGKKMKFSILTGKHEKNSLEITQQTKNAPLKLRELEVEIQGVFTPVLHFAGFSTREMAEIRSKVTEFDSFFDPKVEFSCSKCNQLYVISLMSMPTFFYPEM